MWVFVPRGRPPTSILLDMLRLLLVGLPLIFCAKSCCFFCSRSSSSEPSIITNVFASKSQAMLARDGSSMERAEEDSTTINSYGAFASSYTSIGPLIKEQKEGKQTDMSESKQSESKQFESKQFEYDTMAQIEADYPLCKHFDRKLRSQNSQKYVPAIRWSRVFGGPAKNCQRKDFRVGSLIGKGAFGKVMKATHLETGMTVALKYIQYDSDQLASLSEIRQEECLQHRMEDFRPVARHYCTFDITKSTEKYVVLVLEHIDGDELFHVIYGNAPRWPSYDEDNLLTWTAQLIIILRELHARNIVILDLKPENLILERNGNLRLIDFGLAGDPTRPSEYSLGRSVGTPMYIPPEFIHEDRSESSTDPDEDRHQFSTDWYCLGLTLYEILYREAPFDTKDEYSLYMQIKDQGVKLKRLPTERGMYLADLIAGFCLQDVGRRLGVLEDTDAYLAGHPFFLGISMDTYRLQYTSSLYAS